jgi:acyl-CoA thioester hydrolase
MTAPVPEPFRGTWRDGWYVVPHHVLFGDLDAFGHVNNAVYFTYFEWGRTQLWFELTEWGGARDVGFILAHAECDFRLQLEMEPIEIWTRIAEMGTSSLHFECQIRKRSGGEVAATGKIVAVLFDWARQSKRAIDDELRRKVADAGGTRSDSSGAGAPSVPGDRLTA